jgi:hypothetical protein
VADESAVIANAVRAYRFARERAKLARRVDGRECVRLLAEQWPEFYSANGPGGHVMFCGKSADEILEEWVQAHHPDNAVGRREWSRLCAIVIWRGEREDPPPTATKKRGGSRPPSHVG